jgi:transcriptional regulator with XRE-family HTH domain
MRSPSRRLRDREALRRLIKASGMTYQQIGDRADCHRSMLDQLVKGRRPGCSEALAKRLADTLGVDADVLFVESVSIDSRQQEAVAS